jgi:hypothetical protein
MMDAERKLPMVGFKVDGKSYTFVHINNRWWHRR